MSSGEGLVEAYRAASEAEAHIVKGLLESNGIPCVLTSDLAPSVYAFPLGAASGMRVMVRQSDAAEARELVR